MRRRDFLAALPLAGSLGRSAANRALARPPQRSAVYAGRGMVVTSQPLAAQVGLDVLQAGGTAVDAALATAGVLTVMEPMSAGLGGHCTAMVYAAGSGELFGMRSEGQRFVRDGRSVRIPGCVDGWAALHGRFGRRPLADLLSPAIELADNGAPIAEATAALWARHADQIAPNDPAVVEPLLPGGVVPQAGQVVPRPDLAATLRLVALRGRVPIYEGELSTRLLPLLNDELGDATDGPIDAAALAAQSVVWMTPPQIAYRGQNVAALPAGGTLLQSLLLLEPYDIAAMRDDPALLRHLLLESMRLASADAVGIEERIDPTRAAELRRRIDPNRTRPPSGVGRSHGGGTGLVAADGDGNVCSLALWLGRPFGSGRRLPDSGLLLADAEAEVPPQSVFVLDRGEPTIAMTVAGPGEPVLAALDVLTNLIDAGLSPSLAVAAPRMRREAAEAGSQLALEAGFSVATIASLRDRGYAIEAADDDGIGRVQLLMRRPIYDTLIGLSDPRDDGLAAGY